MRPNRRRVLVAGIAGLAFAPRLSGANARSNDLLDLRDDDGRPVPNFRLPSELSASGLPGVVWTGPVEADVILVEFFDYNCPYCRKASADLDAIVGRDGALRLGLVNNPILTPVSPDAAKAQQSVLRLYGPDRAYDFHKRFFAMRGVKDGRAALALCKDMTLDAAALSASMQSAPVGNVLKRQLELAAALDFTQTPAFMLHGVGLLGYPGRDAMQGMIEAQRACDRPKC